MGLGLPGVQAAAKAPLISGETSSPVAVVSTKMRVELLQKGRL